MSKKQGKDLHEDRSLLLVSPGRDPLLVDWHAQKPGSTVAGIRTVSSVGCRLTVEAYSARAI
jgi:hypothetical protein